MKTRVLHIMYLCCMHMDTWKIRIIELIIVYQLENVNLLILHVLEVILVPTYSIIYILWFAQINYIRNNNLSV